MTPSTESETLSHLRTRLAETIAWCRHYGAISDPKNSLRTPKLRPANLATSKNQWGNCDYKWGTHEETYDVVEALAGKRAALLYEASIAINESQIDMSQGRLLVAVPEESDWCGLSELDSKEFIDVLDVPAWDTWVAYIHEATILDEDEVRRAQEQHRNNPTGLFSRFRRRSPEVIPDWQPPSHVSYILCWIPLEFEPLVEMGIVVNPVECFRWVEDEIRQPYTTATWTWLQQAGLLRPHTSSKRSTRRCS